MLPIKTNVDISINPFGVIDVKKVICEPKATDNTSEKEPVSIFYFPESSIETDIVQYSLTDVVIKCQ